MKLLEKCERFYERVQEEIERIGAYPYFVPISAVNGNRVIVDGKEMIMVGSNNYLGLWDHPEVKEASKEAIDRFGVSTCGSRFLNGTNSLHIELEEKLAEFMKKEACQCFSTGFQANLGAISALVGKDDLIIVDRAVHASIIDAARLSFGELVKFKHNDTEDLERVLTEIPKDRGKLIVIDGVFSMEGDLADLPRIAELAKKYDAMLMVDDAHGVGVLGDNGIGTAEYFNLLDEVDLIMGTFSKSFASLGGFVVGKKEVISYIKHNARSLIFSASMTPASAASALTALKIIQREPERRKRLWEITNRVKSELNSMGFDTGFTQTPIIPIILKEDEKAFALWKVLKEMGIFTNPIISPAVPPGRALIRTSYTATHTDKEISIVLESIYRAGKMLGLI